MFSFDCSLKSQHTSSALSHRYEQLTRYSPCTFSASGYCVIRNDTEFVMALIRTAVFNPDDVANVEAIQSGYGLTPLSEFTGTAPPAPAQIVWCICGTAIDRGR